MRLLLLALMVAPMAALAQGSDGGPAPSLCGDELTSAGACYGETAAWCSLPNEGGDDADAPVHELGCAELELDDDEVGAECVLLDDGAWCGVQAGRPCAVPVAGAVLQLACLAGAQLDDGAACDLGAGCVASTAECGSGCDGARALVGCARFGQALVVDCAALGGACEGGACVDVEEGGHCGSSSSCGAGLVCAGDDDGLGTCAPEGAPVAPVDPPVRDPPPAAPACSSGAVRDAAAPAWPLSLVGILLLCVCHRANDGCRRARTP